MSMLHTVNKSPFEKNSLESCLGHTMPGDAVLMIEDGVVGARKGTAIAAKLTETSKDRTVYVLGPDMAARGMSEDNLADGIKVVDYAGFVDLAAEHDKTHAWL